jgi:hypothetical protein
LAVYGNDYWRVENARGIAESHFDLVRIRAVRAEVPWGVGGLENCVGDELNQALSVLRKLPGTNSELAQGYVDAWKLFVFDP